MEFDSALRAKIEPSDTIKKRDVPEHCLITFFGDVIKRMLSEGRLKKVGDFKTCTVVLPIYETEFDGKTYWNCAGLLRSNWCVKKGYSGGALDCSIFSS
ncbi:hypothetical protein [Proteiniborus sp. MB09-C3]|uniref:hypothetical protein n=1 Tax=Proteiniborus sp. MB09-C3 TaxID=3050072 RepID=UPI002556EF94|nr:hypothetical protein [Proteiniborus sp. MB09-C3]WIV11066.1 hypothetical protein QO263_13005 [Proteiniborus sp. MB09-C3]